MWRWKSGANGGRSAMKSGLLWTVESPVECMVSPERRTTTTKSTGKKNSHCFALYDKWTLAEHSFGNTMVISFHFPCWGFCDYDTLSIKAGKEADTLDVHVNKLHEDFKVSPNVTLTLTNIQQELFSPQMCVWTPPQVNHAQISQPNSWPFPI